VTGLLGREPVRVYLYTVLVAVVGLLLGYDVVEPDKAVLWITLGGAVLAVEGARSRVSPVVQGEGVRDERDDA
jgi:xanthosine utilization system XapX-like protein